MQKENKPYTLITTPFFGNCLTLWLVCFSFLACHKIDVEQGDLLQFSTDTICFQTIFAEQTSPTQIFQVYNRSAHTVVIQTVSLQDGQYFQLNIDGEANEQYFSNFQLAAGDSLYVFVQAFVPEQSSNEPVAIEDAILFSVDNQIDTVHLLAASQNVEVLQKVYFTRDTTLSAERPYLVYDYLAVDTNTTLTIAAGATFYMHNNAQIVVYGNLYAEGEQNQPITFRGDRLDDIFDSIPYDYVSGRWDGIYLLQVAGYQSVHSLSHVTVKGATNAIYAGSPEKDNLMQLSLTHSKLHNAARYGLVLINTNAVVGNSCISNAGAYCVYLQGGQYEFVHNTIASFYGNTELNVMTEENQDVAALYINDLSKQYAHTSCLFANNIIDGRRKNNLVLATPLPQYFDGLFTHNFVRCDTLNISEYGNLFQHNHFANENDTMMFIDDRYDYETRTYFDFHLDSLSPARGLADEDYAQPYPIDLDGITRPANNISAGCYQ